MPRLPANRVLLRTTSDFCFVHVVPDAPYLSLANISLQLINVHDPDKLLLGRIASEMANHGVTIHLSTLGLHHHLVGEIVKEVLNGMLRHRRTCSHDMGAWPMQKKRLVASVYATTAM